MNAVDFDKELRTDIKDFNVKFGNESKRERAISSVK